MCHKTNFQTGKRYSFFSIVLVFSIANKQIGLVIAGVCWIIGSIISFVSAFGMKELFQGGKIVFMKDGEEFDGDPLDLIEKD